MMFSRGCQCGKGGYKLVIYYYMNFRLLLKKLSLAAFFLLNSTFLFAQATVVTGKVIDATDKETLPFVTVSFPGTTIGVTTDNDGKFTLSTSYFIWWF